MTILTYTCLNCDETTTDESKVRILSTGKIGWVTCLDCLEKFGVEYA